MPHDFSTVFDNQVLCKYCGKSNPETPGNIRKGDEHTNRSMKDFFDQDVAQLKLDQEDHVKVERMGWFDVKIPLV